MFSHKNYNDMNWEELITTERKRDRIEIIRQLNLLDQHKNSRDTKLVALISSVISIISLIVSFTKEDL